MAALALSLAVALVLVPGSTRAQGLDETCPLALTRLEPTTTNALLLDTHAVYWVVSYQGVPGTRIRITGRFPRSRYMSYNVYDAEARPIDGASDAEIAPDAGSQNPFLDGANRRISRRSYTLYVDFAPRPSHPAPNTLYAGQANGGSPNYAGSIWYRVYLPDRGTGETGGVGLPNVTLEPASTQLPLPLGTSPCSTLEPPTANAVNQFIAGSPAVPTLPLGGYPGRNPPRWRFFVNLSESMQDILTDNQTGDRFPHQPSPVMQGPGFFANFDNAYVYAPTSRGFGPVIVIKGRAPTFPSTRPHAPKLAAGKQVRYFSFCQYDPLSQRVIDCRSDDEIAVDRAGRYTIVVSTAADRPRNAVAACGNTWLAWGPTTQGLLIYRQVRAKPSFAQAIARIMTPGNEQQVMGRYYPSASYLPTHQAFEQMGCRRASHHHHTRR